MVRRSNFHHQASPRVSPRDSTQRRNVELWARNVREFCLNADLHVTFMDLLHAVMLLTEGVLRNFFRPKIPTASAGCEPANLGTKGQHATSRPPKPLCWPLVLAVKYTNKMKTKIFKRIYCYYTNKNIYVSVPKTAAYDISISKSTLLSASVFDFENRRLFLSLVTYGLHWVSNLTPV